MDIKIKILSALIFNILRAFKLTWKIVEINPELAREARKIHPRGGILYAIWHQNAILGLITQKHLNARIMISRSKDGDIVAYNASKLGHVPLRGGSSSGGGSVREQMSALVSKGKVGAITVDGPRGPCYQVKPGIVAIARETGAPILAISLVARRYFRFARAWDRFRLPFPFTTVYVYHAPPFSPGPQFEDECEEVKKRLHAAEAEIRARYFIAIPPDYT